MSKFEINGVELEYDAFDMDTVEKFTAAKQEVADQVTALADTKDIVKVGRAQCKAVKGFFDTVFGEGMGEKVCGEKDNLKACAEAYGAMLREDFRQGQEFQENNPMTALVGEAK